MRDPAQAADPLLARWVLDAPPVLLAALQRWAALLGLCVQAASFF